VNLGGEPERDDFGLPPVDIEIPDDARELDRDVQAYRRELRALRRHQRRMRWHRPLTRDGMVLPMLAACLVLALIAGTLLTVFAVGPGGELPGASQPTPPVAPLRPSTQADTLTAAPGPPLPDKDVQVGGRSIALHTLTPAVLALVPVQCRCAAAVNRLIRQATRAGVPVYLIGSAGELSMVQELARQAPDAPLAAEDVTSAVNQTYFPTGLTALLAQRDGTVAVAAPLGGSFRLDHQLARLSPPSPG